MAPEGMRGERDSRKLKRTGSRWYHGDLMKKFFRWGISFFLLVNVGCAARKTPILPPPMEPLERISRLYERGDFKRAYHALSLISESGTHDPKRDYLRGKVLLELEEYSKGRQSFQIVLKQVPALADYALFGIAESYRREADWQHAIPTYRQLLKEYPSSVHYAEATIALAEALLTEKRPNEAWKIIQPLTENSVRIELLPQALSMAAYAAEATERSAEAIALWERVWADFPKSEEASVAASRLRKSQRFSSDLYYRRALHWMEAYEYEEACSDFHKAEKLAHAENSDALPEIQLSYGKCLYQLRKYHKALQTFQKVYWRQEASDREEVLFWLGKTYQRRQELNLARASYEEFLRLFPQSPKNPSVLQYLAGIYEKEGETDRSRALWGRLIREFPQSDRGLEARWELGWSAFKANDYADAIKHFEEIANNPAASMLEQARSLYWLIQGYRALGKTGIAKEIEQRLLREFPSNYYSLLLAAWDPQQPFWKNVHTHTNAPLLPTPLPPPLLYSSRAKFHWERFKTLYELFLFKEAAVELEVLELLAPRDRKTIPWLSRQWLAIEHYYRSQRIVRLYFQNTLHKPIIDRRLSTWSLAYSKGFSHIVEHYSQKYELDPNLVFALIQEESRFQEDALSSSRARGLMQIIPATGKYIARKVGLRPFSTEQLWDPEINIRLGTAYLRKLLDQFDGNWLLALAGYNGGPHNVKKWYREKGDIPLDQFVEEIPFQETRNYVKRVLTSYAIYTQIYGGAIPLEPVAPASQKEAV